MRAINKQDLIDYLRKSPENLNFNIFGKMLDDFRNTYEADEQIVNKIKGIITNIIDSGESISPEDDTITELVDLITELLPEKMIIKPVGTLEITENGEYDVMNKAGVNVSVPLPSGTVSITQNGTTNVNDYEYANINVVDALGNLTRNNATNLKFSEGPTNIENQTFKNCTNLEEIIIPNSVTNIGNEAFYNCSNLTTINGGFRVRNIGTDAFYNCPSVLSNGTTGDCKWAQYNGTLTIDGNGNMANYEYNRNPAEWRNNIKIIINNGVTGIGTYAFDGCTNLTSVTIPNSVGYIAGDAFRKCTGLTSIEIPDSVTNIGNAAFSGCTGLTSITIPNNITNIGETAFDNTAWYNNQPDGIIYAGKIAYKYKGSMPYHTSITIQDGTKRIGAHIFRNCTNLTSVTIPNSVTNIGEGAFSGCTGLTSVTIPDGVTSIINTTFYNCTGLTSIEIPDSVTSIGDGAFQRCSSLTDVYYTGTEEEWNSIQIGSNNETLTDATIHYNYTPSN